MKSDKNKVVVITGGSRGIGKATALEFGKLGYKVMIIYKESTELAKRVVDEIKSFGAEAEAFKCDVSIKEKVDETFELIYKKYGFVDILVNNAGIADMSLFTDIDEKAWDNIFNVNVKGVFHCCKAVLPSMISEKTGNIVNVASVWGEVGASLEVHYSATKGAVISMTKALAKEEALSNIRINAVSPGAVKTDMLAGFSESELREFSELVPQYRLGEPKEIADAIIFLATEKSSYITGQVLSVNGGLTV